MGPIAGQWINEQTKLEILTVIETSQQHGVSVRRSCSILAIEQRRIVRWRQRARQGQSLANLPPLRSAEARTQSDLIQAIAAALQRVSPQDAMNWFILWL